MPRPKAEERRDRQVLLRLTARQYEVLDAVAHLTRQTPNAYAHQVLIDHLAGMAHDQHVIADIANRAAFDASGTHATPLRGRKQRGSAGRQQSHRDRQQP